jgi:hypothetical protein
MLMLFSYWFRPSVSDDATVDGLPLRGGDRDSDQQKLPKK